MANDLPHVLIIIVTWNKQEYLQRLLDSIQQISYPNYSVLVVDNASTDNTEAIIKQFDFVIHQKLPENLGGAGGFNAGLKYAIKEEYPYVWLLDDDTEVDSEALKKLVSFYLSKEKNNIGFLGSRINLLQHKEIIQEAGGRLDIRHGDIVLNCHLETKAENTVYKVDVVPACSLFTSREVIQQVGLINHSFFITCDDIEWSLRTKSKGFENFVISDAVIYHNFIWAGDKLFDSFRIYYHIRNFLQVLQYYLTIPQFGWVLLRRLFLYFVLSVHFVVSKQMAPVKTIIQAYLDFVNNKMGKKDFTKHIERFQEISIPTPHSKILCTFFLEDVSKLITWVDKHPEVKIDILSRKKLNLLLDSSREEYSLSVFDLLRVFMKKYYFIVCYERSLLFHLLATRFKRYFLIKEDKLVTLPAHVRLWMILRLIIVSLSFFSAHVFIYFGLLAKRIFGRSALEKPVPF
jgi:GT2 family glycosyltransferase